MRPQHNGRAPRAIAALGAALARAARRPASATTSADRRSRRSGARRMVVALMPHFASARQPAARRGARAHGAARTRASRAVGIRARRIACACRP